MACSILVLEDSAVTARRIIEEIRLGGFECDTSIVATREDFIAAIRVSATDIILADQTLPGFSGTEALSITALSCPDTPFLFVTATVDTEMALDLIHSGAMDVIFKDKLERLVPAIKRAWHHRCERLAGHTAMRRLENKTRQLQAITDTMSVFLQTGNCQKASGVLLAQALEQTQSQYGFTAVLSSPHTLRTLAFHGAGWGAKESAGSLDAAPIDFESVGYLEFRNSSSLIGMVVTSRQPVLRNETITDSQSEGLPAGHPPLANFLGVPFLRGAEVVGVIGVANRAGGFQEVQQKTLELLAQMAGVLFECHLRVDRETLLQEQLRQSQKSEAVGRLAGGIAHDFNNILSVIGGHADLLSEALLADDPRRADVQQISKSVDRATSLTRQLLAMSRKQVIQPTVLNINGVITEMSKMLRRMIGEDIKLVTKLESSLGCVMADVTQIEQVLMNLVVNARDAMPCGGTIAIETANADLDEIDGQPVNDELISMSGRWRRAAAVHDTLLRKSYIMLSLSDTGCGMDDATRSRVFEPFFTTKEAGRGTGLGLSTVYGIVKQSGGHIAVNSAPGAGSTFRIYLQRTELRPDARPAMGSPSVLRGLTTETILLVEDDEDLRALLSRTLRERDYTVLEAHDADSALVAVDGAAGSIRLLVTDVVMPGESGRHLARKLVAKNPGLRVLFISGYTDDVLGSHGVLDSDVMLLPKPFSTSALLQKVREILDLGLFMGS